MLQLLLKNIHHHAPSIQCLHLTKTAINLMNMEIIRLALPSLNELVLEKVYLYTDDSSVTGGAVSASKNILECFSLVAQAQNRLEVESSEFEQTLIHWTSYIGENYNLRQLDFHCGDYDYSNSERNFGAHLLEDALVSTLSKMKKMQIYSATSIPLSRRILNTMEDNKIQLQKLRLDMKSAYMMNQQIQNIASSISSNNIKSLDTHFNMHHNGYALSNNNLINICSPATLKNLNELKAEGAGHITLFFDILYQLPQLEILDLSTLFFATNEAEQQAYEILISQQPGIPSSIKSLNINMHASSAPYCWTQISRIYSYIFKLCPQLKHLKLTGMIYANNIK